jgi:hypothetical protein
MNENFTRRLEGSFQRGMATVATPAAEPEVARYRTAPDHRVRRPVTRFTVAFAAIGMGLLTSLVAAAASETSPTTIVSTAVYSMEKLVEQVLNPAVSEQPPVEPASPPTPGDLPTPGGTNDLPLGSVLTTIPMPSPDPGMAPQPADQTEPSQSESPPASPAIVPSPKPSDQPLAQTGDPANQPQPVVSADGASTLT